MTRLACLCIALPLLACAHARPPGSPPETSLSVTDPDGSVLTGEIHVLGLEGHGRESCNLNGTTCEVAVPAGVYLIKFHKMRGGRVGHIGSSGPSGTERGTGCLLSRVRLEPGKPILCKSNGGFDPCRHTRVHTMNCGEAVVQQWSPKPGEPADITGGDPEDAPAGGEPVSNPIGPAKP